MLTPLAHINTRTRECMSFICVCAYLHAYIYGISVIQNNDSQPYRHTYTKNANTYAIKNELIQFMLYTINILLNLQFLSPMHIFTLSDNNFQTSSTR